MRACNSVEVGLDPSVPDPIDLELEAQARAIDDHLESKVQIVELDAPRCGQTGEQAPGHGVEVGRQRAHVHQIACVRRGGLVGLAGD